MILNSILVVIQELDEMNLFDKENIAESKKNKNSTCTEIVEDNKEKDGMLGDETIYEEMFAKVIPVSSSTGAGIQYLWEELNKCARKNSKPIFIPPIWGAILSNNRSVVLMFLKSSAQKI